MPFLKLISTERKGREGERGGKKERERNVNSLFYLLFMHSLVALCIYPDQGLNLQPWHIRTMLQATELPCPGLGSVLSATKKNRSRIKGQSMTKLGRVVSVAQLGKPVTF